MPAAFRAKAQLDTATFAATQTLTLSVATQAGDCVAVLGTVATASDVNASGLGATWTKRTASFVDGPVYLFIGTGCSGTGNTTDITLTFTGSNDGGDWLAVAVSGAPKLATSILATGTSNAPVGSPITPDSSAGDVIVVDLMLIDGLSTPTSFTDTPGAFTTDINVTANVYDTITLEAAHRVPAELSAQSRQANTSASNSWAAAAVLFNQAGPSIKTLPFRPAVNAAAVQRAATL